MDKSVEEAFSKIRAAIAERPEGARLPQTETEKKIEAMCLAGLTIAESIVESLERIASALEERD